MPRKPIPAPSDKRRTRGFEAASGLLSDQIRQVGEARGFAVARLLTHWPDVAGPELAAITRPVKVGYGREGMGATLTLLTSGPMAPMVEMQKEQLRAKVNAIYGYAAISRILITQTAATGFAEGQAEFAPAPKTAPKTAPDPMITEQAARTAAPIQDAGLRHALETLAQNVLDRQATKKGSR